jgi:3'-phosphoadenosine 5'-phosphosulfate sulfotransferase (PAPS reductase)/FAD synthetase
MSRVVSWFSCGAASAVATILAAQKYEKVHAVYCRVRQEHEDNLRFLKDFSNTTGIPVETIENEKHKGSIFDVFLTRKYIKNQHGAPCTMLLKKEMRKQYQRVDDIQVFGYTAEEQDRADRFLDANNEVQEDFILLDQGVTKPDCLNIIRILGIKIPVMYRLGYKNNNCIGCVKGGMGYWNAIRKDFPEAFDKMAKLERTIGHAINKDKNGPVFLDELDPKRGHKIKDMPGDCGFTCEVNDA